MSPWQQVAPNSQKPLHVPRGPATFGSVPILPSPAGILLHSLLMSRGGPCR